MITDTNVQAALDQVNSNMRDLGEALRCGYAPARVSDYINDVRTWLKHLENNVHSSTRMV